MTSVLEWVHYCRPGCRKLWEKCAYHGVPDSGLERIQRTATGAHAKRCVPRPGSGRFTSVENRRKEESKHWQGRWWSTFYWPSFVATPSTGRSWVYSTRFVEDISDDFWGRRPHHGDGENVLGTLHGEIKAIHTQCHVLIISDSMLRGMAHPEASTYQTPLVHGHPTSITMITYRSRAQDILLNRKYDTITSIQQPSGWTPGSPLAAYAAGSRTTRRLPEWLQGVSQVLLVVGGNDVLEGETVDQLFGDILWLVHLFEPMVHTGNSK